jgi:hypothetical protein
MDKHLEGNSHGLVNCTLHKLGPIEENHTNINGNDDWKPSLDSDWVGG